MEEKYSKRQIKEYCAKNIKSVLLNKLIQIKNMNTVNYHDLLTHSLPTLTNRLYGIRIEENKNIKRMEIRYPEGTLNKKVLQNYINFSLKLITACKNGTLDQEQLAYLTRKEIRLYEEGNDCIYKSNPKAFESLIEKIATSTEDKDDFSKQYQKVLSTKK